MKRRWWELLLGLGALHSSTAASASSSSTKQPLTFYVNKPSASIPESERAIATNVRTARGGAGAQSERKLVFDAYDSRRALDDWELEDYVLVATIEGSLYALDRKTGATRWKLDGNEPAVRSGNSGGDAEVGNNTEGNWAGGEQQPRWIVQPVEGGQLFLFDPEYGVLVISSPKMVLTEQELPLTIKQLIDHGAFKIPGDDKVYTGKKETQLVAVDSKTGKVLSQYGARSGSMGGKCRIPGDPLDELDDECDAAVEGDVLMIGKTSTLSAF
jgi:serine/threonine-protein kinase/endoribonuclease IRE1